MKKFSFCSTITISVNTEVEADTLEEAIGEARGRGMASLCYSCTRHGDEEWTPSDLDGELRELEEVLVDGEEGDLEEARKLW